MRASIHTNHPLWALSPQKKQGEQRRRGSKRGLCAAMAIGGHQCNLALLLLFAPTAGWTRRG